MINLRVMLSFCGIFFYRPHAIQFLENNACFSVFQLKDTFSILEIRSANMCDMANYGTIFDLNGVTLFPPLRF